MKKYMQMQSKKKIREYEIECPHCGESKCLRMYVVAVVKIRNNEGYLSLKDDEWKLDIDNMWDPDTVEYIENKEVSFICRECGTVFTEKRISDFLMQEVEDE